MPFSTNSLTAVRSINFLVWLPLRAIESLVNVSVHSFNRVFVRDCQVFSANGD